MSNSIITPASLDDLPSIYQLFEAAIQFQKLNKYIGWNSYDKTFIRSDIKKGLLYKWMDRDKIICIFSICYSDPLIWRDKEKGDAIYLHRAVVNQQYKGQKAFQQILGWVIQLAREHALKYVRMDTWADNEKIIAYYKTYGFRFIDNYTTADTENLPLQHRNLKVALLELPLENLSNAETSFSSTPSPKNLEKVSIGREFTSIRQYWTQQIIGEANGQLIKLAKGIGEVNWHKHEDQDELFILYKGHLTIQLREKNIELYKDDLFIVPRGVEHCPKADGEVAFLIMGLNVTSTTAGGRPDWADNN